MDGSTPSSQSLLFQQLADNGRQFNTTGGIQNNNTGSGHQFIAETINIGTKPSSALLHSLSFKEMGTRFKDIKSAAKGTCEWLLRHDEYKAWATRDRSLLWIQGKPGSGKSTLLHYALKNVNTTAAKKDNTIFLSFFFHSRGGELQKSLLGFFQSLLHQLLQHLPEAPADLQTDFDEKCKNYGEPGQQWKWHLTELRGYFRSSLKEALKSRSIWLFVDALDECGKDGANKLVKDFKSWLQGTDEDSDHPSSHFQFRVCFSCRHYPIQVLDYGSIICVEEENTKDISTYVHTELSWIPDDIREIIISHASGVFMWVRLIGEEIDSSLGRGEDWEMIRKNIMSAPEKLSDLYARLVQRMKGKKTKSDSLKLIQWICFAMRPLSLSELRWAVIVDPEVDSPRQSLEAYQSADNYISDEKMMEKKVKSLGCGIVEVMQPSQRVQFIHQSVKDYFLNGGLSTLEDEASTQKGNRRDVEGRAHYQLSRICIRYFFMEEIRMEVAQTEADDDNILYSKYPLLQYAVNSWVSHVNQSETQDISQRDLLEYFEWPSNKLVNIWWQAYCAYNPHEWTSSISLVHILAQFNIIGPLRKILQHTKKYINIRDDYNQTPLLLAAEHGHEAVVKLLLTAGKNDTTADNHIRQSLFTWARSKYPFGSEVVDVDATDNFSRTPLICAAESGHVAVVKLLLATGRVNINKTGYNSQTPLLCAAKCEHVAVVKLLLETGKANINTKDEYGQTPLSYAAMYGHIAITKLLLETGRVDINTKDDNGKTPLSHAAMYGHNAIIKLLLKTGRVDINTKDDNGDTPFTWAIRNGNEAVVNRLLDTGKLDTHRESPWVRKQLVSMGYY
ncbi:sex-determining protein fem-1 [Nannizzia gypsea CBS 118893]|uniref:Sex-determining protein fem-1 n=1 Tax=Arthroderma gypseum (strain ATCC MYA-4604 / CBS 118893) TaxID=535722 RepID=E4V1Q8_ARTGP|nr:sex-determining protein fem-1 [Nannizzia gypsea CBS 118893]EFR03973.1 sex-determining protein fem-1 [Nannizzia gypsea CBS 118893]